MTEIPNTNGFYYQRIRREELPLVFFFYEDGTVLTSNGGGTKKPTSDPEEIMNEFRHEMTYRFKGELKKEMVTIPWDKQSGHYYIKNDSVYVQYFYGFVDYWVKRNMIELTGIMQSDSIMIFKQMRVYGARKKHSGTVRNSAEVDLNPPALLTFHKYNDFKPDSSIVWFKRKNWYTKNLFKNK